MNEESLESIGDQIDTENLKEFGLNVPAGETKSFKIEQNYLNLTPTVLWVWDFEIITISLFKAYYFLLSIILEAGITFLFIPKIIKLVTKSLYLKIDHDIILSISII